MVAIITSNVNKISGKLWDNFPVFRRTKKGSQPNGMADIKRRIYDAVIGTLKLLLRAVIR